MGFHSDTDFTLQNSHCPYPIPSWLWEECLKTCLWDFYFFPEMSKAQQAEYSSSHLTHQLGPVLSWHCHTVPKSWGCSGPLRVYWFFAQNSKYESGMRPVCLCASVLLKSLKSKQFITLGLWHQDHVGGRLMLSLED